MSFRKRMRSIAHFIFISMLMLQIAACRHSEDKSQSVPPEPLPFTPEELNAEAKIIEVEGGFGYDIFVNNQPYIHQPHIPSINGNQAFKTKEDAEKVADLVVQKIEGNIIPPSVSPEELQALGITFDQ